MLRLEMMKRAHLFDILSEVFTCFDLRMPMCDEVALLHPLSILKHVAYQTKKVDSIVKDTMIFAASAMCMRMQIESRFSNTILLLIQPFFDIFQPLP